MGWVERKDPPHFCDQPNPGSPPNLEFGDGSVWGCDVCGEDWVWESHIFGYGGGLVWYRGGESEWVRLSWVLTQETLQKEIAAASSIVIEPVKKRRWWYLW